MPSPSLSVPASLAGTGTAGITIIAQRTTITADTSAPDLCAVQANTFFVVCCGSLLLASCGKTINEWAVKGEFRYVNTLPSEVRILLTSAENGPIFYENVIAPGDTLELFTDGDTHAQIADPAGYNPAVNADTTTMIFADTLCYSEYHGTGQLLQNISAYTYQKRGDRNYLFYFLVDSTLVRSAKRCN